MKWRDKVMKESTRGDNLQARRLKKGRGQSSICCPSNSREQCFTKRDRWVREVEQGWEKKGEGWAQNILLNPASPVTSHTAAVSIEHTMACLKNERSNHSSVIKMPLILARPPSRKKYTSLHKRCWPQATSFPCKLVSTRVPGGKNVVSFG